MKIITSIILVLAPFLVVAHGTGLTFEKTEGEYFVDIGSTEARLMAGKSSRFDFSLYKGTERADVDYNQVWVRLIKAGSLVFVSTLPRPSFGSAGMTYTFPEAGTYDMTVIYQKDGEKILESAFEVPVSENTDKGSVSQLNNPFLVFLIGLVVGSMAVYISKKSSSKNIS